MRTLWILVVAVFGLLAVVPGAFGAHALRGRLSERALAGFEVAVRYQSRLRAALRRRSASV